MLFQNTFCNIAFETEYISTYLLIRKTDFKYSVDSKMERFYESVEFACNRLENKRI